MQLYSIILYIISFSFLLEDLPCLRLAQTSIPLLITTEFQAPSHGRLGHRKATQGPASRSLFVKIMFVFLCLIVMMHSAESAHVISNGISISPTRVTYTSESRMTTITHNIKAANYPVHYNHTPYKLNAALGGASDNTSEFDRLKIFPANKVRNHGGMSINPNEMTASMMRGVDDVHGPFFAARIQNEEGNTLALIVHQQDYPQLYRSEAFAQRWIAAENPIFGNVESDRVLHDEHYIKIAKLINGYSVIGIDGKRYHLTE